MNILHFGCSFTAFEGKFFMGKEKPLMNILSESLHKIFDSVNYYNFSVGGGGTNLQYKILKQALVQHENIDLILFQSSIPGRGFWQHSDVDLSPSAAGKNDLVLDYSHNIRTSFNWYNGINVYPNDKYQKSPRDFQNYVYEHQKFNSFMFEEYIGSLLSVKTLLSKSKIPSILYTHRTNLFTTESPVESEILRDTIDFDVRTELGENRWETFCSDPGTHLNPKGNIFLRDNILIPRIKEKLDS